MNTIPDDHAAPRSGGVRSFALSLVLAGGLAAVGCEQKKAAPPQMPPPAVVVSQPVLQSVQSYYEYNGYLDAVEMVQVRVLVRAQGDDRGDLLADDAEAELALRQLLLPTGRDGPRLRA